jgi:hypothetical protein
MTLSGRITGERNMVGYCGIQSGTRASNTRLQVRQSRNERTLDDSSKKKDESLTSPSDLQQFHLKIRIICDFDAIKTFTDIANTNSRFKKSVTIYINN